VSNTLVGEPLHSMLDEKSAGQTICEAIAFHRLLRLVTTDGDRIDLEPHCFGLGIDGRPVLLGWNVSPIKNAKISPLAWTFCTLHRIRELQILDGSFKTPRPAYASAKSQIRRVYCEA
jgi:hypothetical protein